jgi:flagellin FlaB
MRKLLLFNKKNDVGAIGIGAMIVLIAMILVAGVAASVLIQTSNTLQTQAMRTGAQTIREVSSGIAVYTIDAWVDTVTINDSTVYNNITCLAITVEPRPGSNGIDLNNTFILISDGDTKALLRYDYNDTATFFTDVIEGDFFAAIAWEDLGNDKFAIGVLQDYDNSMRNNVNNPVLNRGDKAVLYIYTNVSAVLNSPINERVEIFGQVIPEFGAPGVISFTSPKAYTMSVYNVQ